jgi:hypothetical protein
MAGMGEFVVTVLIAAGVVFAIGAICAALLSGDDE